MRAVLVTAIRFYRVAISPVLPASCRFHPSCSRYALEAVTRFGALRGSLLAAWRLLRCQPFSAGGFDPVPETWSPLRGRLRFPRRPASASTD